MLNRVCRYALSTSPRSWLHANVARRSFSQVLFDANPDSDALRIGELILIPRDKRGSDIMNDPDVNKGNAFSMLERERLGLRGLIPPAEIDIETQLQREISRFNKIKEPLERYLHLQMLDNKNRTLFYTMLVRYLQEMAPVVYTPTVGLACQKYGQMLFRSRGMYFSCKDEGHMAGMVYNWEADDVKVIVVTDGSRILGLGDLGVNGMGIPIGKLSLYTAIGGIHPSQCLPVVLDMGTDNPDLLADDTYLGLRQKRLRGPRYFALVNEFVNACRERWPNVLIQFEDFDNASAEPLLSRYRGEVLCFNDDIQGTGAVTLAAALAALRAIGNASPTALSEQRIVVLGAGSAGLGVANAILYGMIEQGLTREQACANFVMVDEHGCLGEERGTITPFQSKFVTSRVPDGKSLAETVDAIKPTILIGLTGVPGLFTEEVVRTMAKHCEKPIIFPLSNPTSRAECSAEDAFKWTDGRALVASGSPFEDVTLPDGRVCYPSQANNMWTFPAVGLGATACKARTINRKMLYRAAERLAQLVPQDQLDRGKIFPHMADIRATTAEVAIALAEAAYEDGLATAELHPTGGVRKLVMDEVWEPHYGQTIVSPRNS
jgi:malate dehydrogenase (oxaloacetate-decarboxylating)(NADP+)